MRQLVGTRHAKRLTGLTTEQLRDWTSRRALIPADVKPKGHGSPARYSWQTILLLRIAVVLRDRFKLELQAQRALFSDMATELAQLRISSLYGKVLTVRGGKRWKLVDPADLAILGGDFIAIDLESHLELLAKEFPSSEILTGLRPFPALPLEKRGVSTVGIVKRKEARVAK